LGILTEPCFSFLSLFTHFSIIIDLETQRCIAYALCNLAADSSRRVDIVREGGLPALVSLACSEDLNDVLAAISTLRGISAQPDIRRQVMQANISEAIAVSCRASDVEVR
jgi:hypothetical protein